MKTLWFWSYIATFNCETEESALRFWREDIEREMNHHLPHGTQKTEWCPWGADEKEQ